MLEEKYRGYSIPRIRQDIKKYIKDDKILAKFYKSQSFKTKELVVVIIYDMYCYYYDTMIKKGTYQGADGQILLESLNQALSEHLPIIEKFSVSLPENGKSKFIFNYFEGEEPTHFAEDGGICTPLIMKGVVSILYNQKRLDGDKL